MQYSETRSAPPQRYDCMRQWTGRVNNSTVLEKLTWWQRRQMPVIATSEGDGDRPPTTRLDSRLQRQLWRSFPEMPGLSSSLQGRAITHFAACRRHSQYLTSEKFNSRHEKKFLDWSRWRLNITNSEYTKSTVTHTKIRIIYIHSIKHCSHFSSIHHCLLCHC